MIDKIYILNYVLWFFIGLILILNQFKDDE